MSLNEYLEKRGWDKEDARAITNIYKLSGMFQAICFVAWKDTIVDNCKATDVLARAIIGWEIEYNAS